MVHKTKIEKDTVCKTKIENIKILMEIKAVHFHNPHTITYQ